MIEKRLVLILISLKIKSLEMILAGKISVDRLAARQTKVESGFSKFCKETKATIKYFTDQLEDSD